MLTPEEYDTVSNIPYEVPPFANPLEFARNNEAAVIAQQQTDYMEVIRIFHEAHDVKKALINQVVGAVDGMYLEKLRDEATNNITQSIQGILGYLFENFAEVTAEDMIKEEAALNQLHWNIADPPMVFLQRWRISETHNGSRFNVDRIGVDCHQG